MRRDSPNQSRVKSHNVGAGRMQGLTSRHRTYSIAVRVSRTDLFCSARCIWRYPNHWLVRDTVFACLQLMAYKQKRGVNTLYRGTTRHSLAPQGGYYLVPGKCLKTKLKVKWKKAREDIRENPPRMPCFTTHCVTRLVYLQDESRVNSK